MKLRARHQLNSTTSRSRADSPPRSRAAINANNKSTLAFWGLRLPMHRPRTAAVGPQHQRPRTRTGQRPHPLGRHLGDGAGAIDLTIHHHHQRLGRGDRQLDDSIRQSSGACRVVGIADQQQPRWLLLQHLSDRSQWKHKRLPLVGNDLDRHPLQASTGAVVAKSGCGGEQRIPRIA